MHNAFFPSEYSLSQYTAPKTNFAGTKFAQLYTGGKFKVLMVATDERYLQMQNGKFFSTGNHPVETLLPMLHIHKAGFEIDVATLSGNHAKFEMWAMPNEDAAIAEIYAEYLPKRQPEIPFSGCLWFISLYPAVHRHWVAQALPNPICLSAATRLG